MAPSPASSSKVAPFIESLECSICAVVFEDPKQLNCGHTFCAVCISKMADLPTSSSTRHQIFSNPITSISCPQCRELTTLPAGGAQKMATNFIVKEMISRMEAFEIEKEKCPPAADEQLPDLNIQCSSCPKKVPKEEMYLCTTCNVGPENILFLCSLCALKTHKEHNLKPLVDLASEEDRNKCEQLICTEQQQHRARRLEILRAQQEMLSRIQNMGNLVEQLCLKADAEFGTLLEQVKNPETTRLNSDLDEKFQQSLQLSVQSNTLLNKVLELRTEVMQKFDTVLDQNGSRAGTPSSCDMNVFALPPDTTRTPIKTRTTVRTRKHR